jgi:hypothetical protein
MTRKAARTALKQLMGKLSRGWGDTTVNPPASVEPEPAVPSHDGLHHLVKRRRQRQEVASE